MHATFLQVVPAQAGTQPPQSVSGGVDLKLVGIRFIDSEYSPVALGPRLRGDDIETSACFDSYPPAISVALPPAAAVLIDTVCSVAKRAR
jgi:hypothetical protein